MPSSPRSRRTTGPDPRRFVCNVVPSPDTGEDWGFEDSVDAGVLGAPARLPASVDLREDWWAVNDQEDTGSCVGWATADGVLRWHLKQAGRIRANQMPSPRHIWMASKETDTITARPQSFIEEAGTHLKSALDVARKHGVALDSELPFHIGTKMYVGREKTFYASCARRKIASYFNLRSNLTNWKTWLAQNGPILAALQVDSGWDEATPNKGKVDVFDPATVRGGHAIAVVGYRTDGRFIVRNSWGTTWGDGGFAYVKRSYVEEAFFDEAYGVTL